MTSRLAEASADHPRAYGEHLKPSTGWAVITGSPPRVRGALHGTLKPGVELGITPARTGSTV